MQFFEVVEQVIELLQRHRRITYGALKRQFRLDDAYLEDLKDELVDARQLAVDELGKTLVWTGDVSPTPYGKPDAERRQLTVMFCDLADSTALSGQLDPEDYREVIRAYQAACDAVIERFEGHIAQYLGDGLLVYFGYPQAHEDDAHRAVRAGLGMVEALMAVNIRLQRERGIRLTLRLGIHTGLVVVGEIGGASRHEQLALGETPNLASHLHTLAEANTVVISTATYRLIQGYFVCQEVGTHVLKGTEVPVQVYRVVRESSAQNRLDVTAAGGLTPLVGRQQEVQRLLERWALVKDGQGQVVLLRGEAGIGKSRLLQVLKEHVANEPHLRLECRCSPYHQHSALYPLIDMFQRALQFQPHESPYEKLRKLETALAELHPALEESVPLYAALLSLPCPEERYLLLPLTPHRQRQKTLDTILTHWLEIAAQLPVLVIMEDLHWVDPSTVEFLYLLADRVPSARIYLLLTCRPTFQVPWDSWPHLAQLALTPLSRSGVGQMIESLTGGKPLPPEVVQQVVAKTDGVPLFVEEVTKMVLESGWLQEADGRYDDAGPLPSLAIPATLQDSLMARLDRLDTVKAVAQLGATIGRTFSHDLLKAVSLLDEGTLQRELSRLVDAELLHQRGVPPHATYLFKHILIQEAAYQSLLKHTRQQYHGRIAQTLDEQFPETAATQPELVAHHYTEADLMEAAIPYWQLAGQLALKRSAHMEAIAHLTKGLKLLETLPDTCERTQHELHLQIALGPALMATKGYADPDVTRAYARARELCQQVGETLQAFQMLFGLWRFYLVRAELQTAHELAGQLLTMAHRQQEPTRLLGAHWVSGATLFFQGEGGAARDHLEQGMALYDPQYHPSLVLLYSVDPGMVCRSYAAWVLWLLGYPDQALQRSQDALALAHELAHPYSLAWAQGFAAMLHQFRREGEASQEQADVAMTLSTEHEFPLFLALGTIMRGWAWSAQGKVEAGLTQLQQGITSLQTMEAGVFLPYGLSLLASAFEQAGQPEKGLQVLTEALAMVDHYGIRWWEAELYRLQGELLQQVDGSQRDGALTPEACFFQALDIARRRQMKSLELRAAISLSRLWQQQGKPATAHELLAEVYGGFTEGFDTIDLKEANMLLKERRV